MKKRRNRRLTQDDLMLMKHELETTDTPLKELVRKYKDRGIGYTSWQKFYSGESHTHVIRNPIPREYRKVTPEQVALAREIAKTESDYKVIAAKVGIAPTYVHAILRGRSRLNDPGDLTPKRPRAGENASNAKYSDLVAWKADFMLRTGKKNVDVMRELGVKRSWVSALKAGRIRKSPITKEVTRDKRYHTEDVT